MHSRICQCNVDIWKISEEYWKSLWQQASKRLCEFYWPILKCKSASDKSSLQNWTFFIPYRNTKNLGTLVWLHKLFIIDKVLLSNRRCYECFLGLSLLISSIKLVVSLWVWNYRLIDTHTHTGICVFVYFSITCLNQFIVCGGLLWILANMCLHVCAWVCIDYIIFSFVRVQQTLCSIYAAVAVVVWSLKWNCTLIVVLLPTCVFIDIDG